MDSPAATGLFPQPCVRAVHHVAVGDGHVLYVEETGAVDGLPLLFLHGGPGSGCSPKHRRLFDPGRFRAVIFDQRGCGRSRPRAGIGTPLSANTTQHLIEDIEAIRRHLGIAQWFIHGGSWGALLALAYTLAHPARVCGVVLRGSFLGSALELDSYLNALRQQRPDAWNAFAETAQKLSGVFRDDPLMVSLNLLARPATSTAEARRQRLAASIWLGYEALLMGEKAELPPEAVPIEKALIQGHYLTNACFCDAASLLAGCTRIAGIPAIVVHGLDDPVCLPATGKAICAAWPGAEWWPLPGVGHGVFQPAMSRAVVAALAKVADSSSRIGRAQARHGGSA